MSDWIQPHVLSAAEAREHVSELEAERALALTTDLGKVDLYMRDLEEDIETWRHEYVIAAVTESATLRGELSGMQVG
jgi:hypothetical protein